MIEELLSSKRELTDQCEGLMNQVRLIDSKYSKVSQELKSKYKREIKSAKEQWMANEKAKRETWMKEKSKEIKTTTIKGLEPELERMLSQSREEKRKLEESFQDKLKEEKLRLDMTMESRMSEMKERLLLDNENNIKKEREFLQKNYQDMERKLISKYEDDTERMTKLKDEELSRIEEIFNREKEFLDKKITQLRMDNEMLESKLKQEKGAELEDAVQRYRQEVDKLEREHFKREKELRNKLQIEFDEKLKIKEIELHKSIEQERDAQIEMIVERMAQENLNSGSEEVTRLKKRLKEQANEHTKELEDLKLELSIYKEKLVEEQRRSDRLDNDVLRMQKKVSDIEIEIEEERKRASNLKIGMRKKEEDLEQEKMIFSSEKKALEGLLEAEKIKTQKVMEDQYRIEIEIKRSSEAELNRRDERHMQELEDIESRIKKVIEKKDSELQRIKEEFHMKEALCDKYEELLERQRKDLLRKL